MFAVIIMVALTPTNTCPAEQEQRLKSIRARLAKLEKANFEAITDKNKRY